MDRIAGAAHDMASQNAPIKAVKGWVVSLFVQAISSCSIEQDRMDAVAWLATAREFLGNDGWSTASKAKKIYALTDSRRLAKGVFRSVSQAYRSYKNADMPLAVKIAIPVTLSAGAILGGPSVGIAGFGSAIGMPILLVIFLGAAGITSVLEAVLSNSEARNYVSIVAYMIAKDEILRRSSHEMRKAMSEEIMSPRRQECRSGDSEVQTMLFRMNPYDFEKHVMSFFQDAGLLAWATKKSNDAGVDGFARHSNGLIVVQCKRNAEENGVGRPTIQQFKGVVEENSAWRGYIVTTSYFTDEAVKSASKNASVILIDRGKLLEWHRSGIDATQYN
ncbi:restriction endonuclease [Candidatus Accumulibacter aalborgensis]|uniref:restriction endonuclease n=1 Tax=Candidatus Accumulibacter aalborgensis TaxID=1860102 RepID=UPI001646DF88|nr:restriction endonuclease [Candidatus Accumulibacter aalborgensis]